MTEEEPPFLTRRKNYPIEANHCFMWFSIAYKWAEITTQTAKEANLLRYEFIGIDCPVLTSLGYLAKPSKSKSRYVLTDKGKAWLVAYIMEHGSVE